MRAELMLCGVIKLGRAELNKVQASPASTQSSRALRQPILCTSLPNSSLKQPRPCLCCVIWRSTCPY